MTNNKSNNTTFAFRTKFEKLVNDENRPVFMAAFKTFCNMWPDTARKTLWCLTYSSAEHLEKNMQILGLNLEIVPSDKVLTLRDELRYQYELLHSEFLAIEIPDDVECLAAFAVLKNHTDAIVANAVYCNCLNCSYLDAPSIDRILGLLKSDKENRYFRGLRDIGFYYDQAQYLKPYHMQIHNLLKALYGHGHQDVHPFKNTPFDGLDDCLKDASIDLPFTLGEEAQVVVEPEVEAPVDTTVQAPVEAPIETPNEAQAEQPVEPGYGFKALTTDAILEHKDVFTTFVKSSDMNLLPQIGRFGFDLNKVISKKDAISKVIEASAKMEEATKALND